MLWDSLHRELFRSGNPASYCITLLRNASANASIMVSSDVISRIFDHDCGSIEEFQRRLVATQLALGWSENSILSPIARAVIIPKQPGASLVLHGLQISAGQAVITQRRCETLKNQLAKDLIDETLTDAMFCTKLAGYGCTLLVDSYSIPGPRDKVPMVCMAIVYPSEGGKISSTLNSASSLFGQVGRHFR